MRIKFFDRKKERFDEFSECCSCAVGWWLVLNFQSSSMVIGLPRNLSKINFVCPTNDSRTQFHLRCEKKGDEKRGDTLNGWQVTDSYSFNRDTPCLFIQPATFSGRPGWKINARNIQIVNKPATLSHVARFIGDVKEFRPLKQRREIYRGYVSYGIALPTFCSVNEWDSSRSSRTILILNIPQHFNVRAQENVHAFHRWEKIHFRSSHWLAHLRLTRLKPIFS